MPLVEYSSSDDEAAETVPEPPAKRRRTAENALPPLPETFHDLYASQVRISTSDDPALHGGRKRATPHAEGNWPTHIYVEWHPSEDEVKALERLTKTLQLQYSDIDVRSHLRSDIGTILPLHISLSAPLVLRAEQKDAFLASVTEAFREYRGTEINAFGIEFSRTRWVSNEASNRWFRVLQVKRPRGNQLNKILELCNIIADEYALPKLYDQPGRTNESVQTDSTTDKTEFFHVSFAWTLTNPATSDTAQDDVPEGSITEALSQLRIQCKAVKVKIGNVVNSIPLSSHYESRKGILG